LAVLGAATVRRLPATPHTDLARLPVMRGFPPMRTEAAFTIPRALSAPERRVG